MQSKEFTNTKKLDYEKPKIKEEVTLEQKALACATSANSVNCNPNKSPGVSGAWWS